MAERTYTRRQWMTRQAILAGHSPQRAKDAVSITAIDHEELDMEESKTMAEWEIAENSS